MCNAISIMSPFFFIPSLHPLFLFCSIQSTTVLSLEEVHQTNANILNQHYTNAGIFFTGESALVYRGYTNSGELVAVKTRKGELSLSGAFHY